MHALVAYQLDCADGRSPPPAACQSGGLIFCVEMVQGRSRVLRIRYKTQQSQDFPVRFNNLLKTSDNFIKMVIFS